MNYELMQLTPHFSLHEFTRSATATRLGIVNEPGVAAISNLQNLCQQILEPLRAHINEASPSALPRREGTANAQMANNESALSLRSPMLSTSEYVRAGREAPLIISSGYRCPALNKAVGGVRNSQHITGEAADIHLPSLEKGREWFNWLKAHTDFDQLIWECSSPRTGVSRHSPYGGERGERPSWIHVSCRRDASLNRHQVIPYLVKGK